jgi:adenine-specific DNA-methyltransferase
MTVLTERTEHPAAAAAAQSLNLPRMRYMGSKYKVVPALLETFSELQFDTALDVFSGSGVVGYALKAMGKQVTSNDFLRFSAAIADAAVANSTETLTSADLEELTSPNADGRDFIERTFSGLYFPESDLRFLDSTWSHIDTMTGPKRSLAIASLCLAAARKQPRGVFTITDLRYDDGRRQLHSPLETLFREAVTQYNAAVFDNGRENHVTCADVFDLDAAGADLVYLDPPYAPPRDDNDYIKRYHFLEGLSVYWEGLKIMHETKTKKIEKRYTPFSYKRTISDALTKCFQKFSDSIIVLSYSSNSVPSHDDVVGLLREQKGSVEVRKIPHRYSFGTHATALRREAHEYIFVAQ